MSIGILISCAGQNEVLIEKQVGGPCEDCIALMDYKLLDKKLENTGVMPFIPQHQAILSVSGIIFQSNGVTPAQEIILYIYQTNEDGLYKSTESPEGWESRHGKHRMWIKTDKNGQYSFKTFQPVSYSNSTEPAHIHIYLKEPGKSSYYIDNIIFQNDPLVTKDFLQKQKNRGGSGLINLIENNDVLIGTRNITLGLNIPQYE